MALRRLVILSLTVWLSSGCIPRDDVALPTVSAPVVHPELWPSMAAAPRDPKIDQAVDDLLARMTLEEKAGQVIQASITDIQPGDVKTYHLGSVLNGGGGWPGDVRKAKPGDWLALADRLHAESMDASDGHQTIPLLWGSDAVHGHSNIVGATLFPHNVGLGATRNYDLIRRIGEVTAIEMATTGIDWDFSPVVAVTRDDRWGRTYESYSEDPEVVRAAAKPMVEGLQGRVGSPEFLGRGKVVSTAKHFIGDGGTVAGKDQGDNVASEIELRDIHGPGYFGAFESGAQAVMVSQSSWHGREMHGHKPLLTDVLKQRLGFDGILVGDWNGHGQVPGCTNMSCPQALNAGLDMFMVPQDWKALHGNIVAQVKSGEIPLSRLDDAVRRILRVKMRAGLFTDGKPSSRPYGGKFEHLGSAEHRAVARQAVRESLVLLKNNGGVLPIDPKKRVLVTGDGADSISKQSGGWTLTWQGDGNTNADFPGGTSIGEGIRRGVESAGGRAEVRSDGGFSIKPDVAIVVFGENPYAEWEGDLKHLIYESEKDLATIRQLKQRGVPIVSVFLSGRPLWVNPFLNLSDAFVAAWLPGTEGAGVADVLLTTPDGRIAHDFKGRLSFSWPKHPSQTSLNRGDAAYDPLFPFGFGLTYADRKDLPRLSEDTTGVDRGNVFFAAGEVEPWTLRADKSLDVKEEAGSRRAVAWPGRGRGGVSLQSDTPADFRREANAGHALAIDIMVEKKPTKPVSLTIGCGGQCGGSLDVTAMLQGLPAGEWRTIRVPLRCFAEAGADLARVDVPFRMETEGELAIRFADIELVPGAADQTCPPTRSTEHRAPSTNLGAGFRWSLYGPDYDPGPEYWAMLGLDMARRFEGSTPETIWIVGKVNGRGTLLNFPVAARDPLIAGSPDDGNEEILSLFDRLGFRVWLQIEPAFSSVDELIDLVLSRYRHHPSVIGFGIDVEWYQSIEPDAGHPISDAQATAWLNAVRKHNPSYKLFLKHWEISTMPPTMREGLVFVDDSQILPSLEAMVEEFATWGRTFAPAPVAFQYGYESDRPWWNKLSDPPREIGKAILEAVPNTKGLYWVDFTALDVFPPAKPKPPILFDDFSYRSLEEMEKNGWILRTAAGWPGVPGAEWGRERMSLIDDASQPDNRLLRMTSSTDGTPANTRQSQFCHERKYLEGTYAARVRFTDSPASGPDGDQVVETFYVISPLKAPMDLDYSELDFEYLPNGGWGHEGPTMFATTWETFHPEPNWKADNDSANQKGALDGWHTLVLQLGAGRRAFYFVDGKPLAEHGGKFFPEVPMSINFNLWFIRNGVLQSREMRTWVEDVDWVFHQARKILTPAEVDAKIAEMRKRGVTFQDTVPDLVPRLESPCDF